MQRYEFFANKNNNVKKIFSQPHANPYRYYFYNMKKNLMPCYGTRSQHRRRSRDARGAR